MCLEQLKIELPCQNTEGTKVYCKIIFNLSIYLSMVVQVALVTMVYNSKNTVAPQYYSALFLLERAI